MSSLISTVLAQGDQAVSLKPPAGGTFADLGDISFSGIVSGLLGLALLVASVVFFFMLVVGGIRWIASGGDKGQTEGARGQITAALIGLVIVFAAWAIMQLIETFFGLEILGGLAIPTIPK